MSKIYVNTLEREKKKKIFFVSSVIPYDPIKTGIGRKMFVTSARY